MKAETVVEQAVDRRRARQRRDRDAWIDDRCGTPGIGHPRVVTGIVAGIVAGIVTGVGRSRVEIDLRARIQTGEGEAAAPEECETDQRRGRSAHAVTLRLQPEGCLSGTASAYM